MQNYEQPPAGPLGEPLNDPLKDPFEDISKAFGPDANFDLFNPFDYTRADLEELFMDNLGKMLNQLEESIETSPPIQPVSGMERDIADNHQLSTRSKNIAHRGWGHSSPPMNPDNTPPADNEIYNNPPTQQTTPPLRIGQSLITGSSGSSTDDRIWCPVKRRFISVEICEDSDCEYYDPDTETCTYDEEQES